MNQFEEREEYKKAGLKEYWWILRKRKWTLITFLTIMVTVVTIGSFKMKPVYRATTQLLIERENPNILSFEEVMTLDTSNTDYYQTQYKILKSRSLAKRVIKELNLADYPEFSAKDQHGLMVSFKEWLKRWLPARNRDAVTDAHSRLVDEFLERIIVVPVRNSRLVDVSAEAEDPVLAAKMANTLVQKYIDQNMETNLFASREAVKWLMNRIEELRRKVEESELALQKYKEENNIVSLEKRQNIVLQKLSELNSKVIEAKTHRIELETMYNQLSQLSEKPEMIESMPAVINNELIRKVKVEYVELEREYSELSKRYKPKHPKMVRLESQLKLLKEKIAAEVNKIANSIKIEYEVAKSREDSLNASLEVLKKEALAVNQKGIKYGVLQREAESNKEMYNILLKRLKETNLTGGLRSSNIRVVDKAEVPLEPVRPKIKLNILLSVVLGLVLGTGLVFFFEYLDNTVKTADDIERFVKLPLLGSIPVIKNKDGIQPETITLSAPKSTISEAYRTVRTGVIFSSTDHQQRSLVVTSAEPKEGKTVTACNLAITMAQAGNRVLLVDADMRKPRIHKVFGVDNSVGLSSLLVGQAKLNQVVQKSSVPNLMVLPCGPIPPNPSELLGSEQMKKLLASLEKEFDRIVLDSPPTMAVADSTILSNLADQLMLVVSSGRTSREVVLRCKQILGDNQSQLLGVVLNNFNVKHRDYYYSKYYYYNYHYAEDEPKGRRRRSSEIAA
jgi:capsular exopolysaccharide synthesis family protein